MSRVRSSVFAMLLGTVLLAGTATRADNSQGQNNNNQGQNNNSQGSPRSVPEFDPAVGGAIAMLLAGGGILLVRRRRA